MRGGGVCFTGYDYDTKADLKDLGRGNVDARG
jgi:hypothetical protein